MKRTPLFMTVVCLLTLTIAPITMAYSYNPVPSEDAWTDASTNSYDTTTLQVQSQSAGTCTPQYTTYLKWDLSSIPDEKTVGTANLTLTVTSRSIPADAVLSLMRVDDDSWTETTVGNIKPAPGAILATYNLNSSNPPAVGSKISFLGVDPSPFTSFLAQQIVGDNVASFALRITSCNTGVTNIRFGSAENAGNEPLLELLGPNSVSLSTFTTDNRAPTWPLYAGLAALAVIAAAGVAWSRRRATQR